MDGAVQAQPLFAPGVVVNGGSPLNLLLVVTEHAPLYALNAGDSPFDSHAMDAMPEHPSLSHYGKFSRHGSHPSLNSSKSFSIFVAGVP